MKSMLVLLLTLFSMSSFASEGNVGFLMNQKYICINQGAMMDGKIVPVLSKEDSLKYPLRIVIDDNNLLQTDGKVKNLRHIEKTTYGDSEDMIDLVVMNDERFIILSSKKMNGMPIVYACVETDNWTLAK